MIADRKPISFLIIGTCWNATSVIVALIKFCNTRFKFVSLPYYRLRYTCYDDINTKGVKSKLCLKFGSRYVR